MAHGMAQRRERLARAQKGLCPWCDQPLSEDLARTRVDHIIPRSRGGPDLSWNRQLLHERCNYAKGCSLTAEAKELAGKHGIVLYEPLPNVWPGSTKAATVNKVNPYRALREAGTWPRSSRN